MVWWKCYIFHVLSLPLTSGLISYTKPILCPNVVYSVQHWSYKADVANKTISCDALLSACQQMHVCSCPWACAQGVICIYSSRVNMNHPPHLQGGAQEQKKKIHSVFSLALELRGSRFRQKVLRQISTPRQNMSSFCWINAALMCYCEDPDHLSNMSMQRSNALLSMENVKMVHPKFIVTFFLVIITVWVIISAE